MNGFKVFAVGAFLYCGPSFCFAQINILENQSEPRSILVKSGDENAYQPTTAADLSRQSNIEAEITSNEIGNPFAGAHPSPSNQLIDNTAESTPTSDPASLPVGTRHPHNPIDQILQNGLISQTLNSAQVPVSWPMQGPDNPTARMMMNTGCTQGLWDNYPAERAAQCALMHQRLAGHQRCKGCAGRGCSDCKGCGQATCAPASAAHFKPVNRYAPAACDSAHFIPASHAIAQQAKLHAQQQPQFKSLLAPAPTLAAPLAEESVNAVPENQDNVAQLPGLFR